MTAPTTPIPNEILEHTLILGGLAHRQIPPEVRGKIAHVPQECNRFKVPHNVRWVVVVASFCGHDQMDRLRASGTDAEIISAHGSMSAVRRALLELSARL